MVKTRKSWQWGLFRLQRLKIIGRTAAAHVSLEFWCQLKKQTEHCHGYKIKQNTFIMAKNTWKLCEIPSTCMHAFPLYLNFAVRIRFQLVSSNVFFLTVSWKSYQFNIQMLAFRFAFLTTNASSQLNREKKVWKTGKRWRWAGGNRQTLKTSSYPRCDTCMMCIRVWILLRNVLRWDVVRMRFLETVSG